jgi:endonuclease YncB( thermonuclease family)
LLKPLLAAGVVPTNGYRTPGDIQRLQAEGYTPAANSLHLNGDAVDLVPGKSGLSLSQLLARAQAIAGRWPSGRVLNEGDHVHLQLPGWGMAPGTPGTPNAGIPPLPAGAKLVQRGSLQGSNFVAPQAALNSSTALTPVQLTGQNHDGDTVGLTNGRNGRLFGVDAFELNQQGRNASGQLVPLGMQGRDYMRSQIGPGMLGFPTGASTFGRPVINLSNDPYNDPSYGLLSRGLGMAEPQYLQGSPQFQAYMQAERLARLNHQGGFQTNAETPAQFRHGNGPWQGATPGVYGQPDSTAVFFDDPTPFAGLRPEIAKAYNDFSRTAKTPEELVAFGKANGFEVPPDAAKKFIADRAKAGGKVGEGVTYLQPPRPLINPGDGAFGSFARGIGDPFNALDELGGVVDTLGGTPGRESVWNAPPGTRFGDVLANNIDQNRAILDYDAEHHPYARVGGQLTSGVLLPMGAASTPGRLAAVMGAEGGFAGLMGGEGSITQRIPNAALGTVLGTVTGGTLGLASEHLLQPAIQRGLNGIAAFSRRGAATDAGQAAAAALPPVPEGFTVQAPASHVPELLNSERTAAMAADKGPSIVGPVVGAPSVHDLPPLPEGFTLQAPFGVTRPVGERLSPEEMANLAAGVNPAGAVPRPASEVSSLDEAVKANPGRFVDVQAPNELDELPVRTVTTATGGKVNVRGPLDLTQSIRVMGGVKDEGGNLASAGITNEARRMPFGSNEQFLGKLVNNDSGMSLEDAAHSLWEDGYFPTFKEPPTADDLIDALRTESTGAQRYFHPDDLAEVENFHNAQAQRYAIDAAAAEGHPLAEDRGSTINLDDLVANTPPTSAYEDTPRLTGKVGNINLDRLEKPGDVNALIDQVASRVGGFDAAARGRVTNEETQRLAQEMGVKPEQLLRRQQGQALNAEQLYAARALVQRSRETVVRLAKQAIGGSDEDLANFRKAWLRHAALEEQVAGATAEAGRALQQFKMLASAKDASGEAVRAYLRGGGGRDNIEDAARAIVDLSEDPAKANRFIADSAKPTWRDKFNELWVNSLLSGPRTHVVNFVGNAVTTAAMIPEQALTAGIGALTRSSDRATIGEVSARLRGMVNGSLEGLKALKSSAGEMVTNPGGWLANEHGPADMATKVENARFHAIEGRKGQIIRLPTRALTAADEFWKSINRNAELHALAYREATKTRSNPAEWDATYERLLQSPTEDMQKQAGDAARYYTFQRELGPTGKLVSQLSNTMPLGKILIPFVKTPINLLKFAGERSVIAPAMPSVRAALMAGGRARDEALARITLGSGLSAAAVLGALSGRLSGGGPTDPGQRAALLQSGWQPYSIRVGNRWVSYSRFDPYSTLLGVAADFAEAGNWATKKEADQVALKLTESVAQNITNKTWLSGLSDAFDVLSDPQRYGGRYVQNLAASMAVPALSAQTAQATDPYLRDARNIVDAIKARVPVLSQTVPARRNVWGEPIPAGDAVGPKILSPFYASTVNPSPLSQEIARLQVPLPMPQRYVTVDGKHTPLSAQQYDELTQLSGKPAKQYLEQAIQSPDYRSMDDDARTEFIKDSLADFREAGRDALLERHPELDGDQRPLSIMDALQSAPRKAAAPAPLPAPPPPNHVPAKPPVLPPLPPGFRLAH